MRLLIALVFGAAISFNVFAEDFKEKHPRRAEVLGRANKEIKKNKEAEADGKITKGQEEKLNRQDRAIKREEQRQAAEHGGHITKAEQARDNRQENRVNKERNNMEAKDAAAAGGTPAAPPSAPGN